jgi:hypothetical protein
MKEQTTEKDPGEGIRRVRVRWVVFRLGGGVEGF